jgi:hypothetical protein
MFDGMRRKRVFVLVVGLIAFAALVLAGAGIAAAATHDIGKDKSNGKGTTVSEETFYGGDYSGIPQSAQSPHAIYYIGNGEHESYYTSGGETDAYYRSGGEANDYYENAEMQFYYYYWFWYWVWVFEHMDDYWDDDSDDDYYTDDDSYDYY